MASVADNVTVLRSKETLLYSGKLGDRWAFDLANDAAKDSDGAIRIIDNTGVGR